jgi:hypothetical protein
MMFPGWQLQLSFTVREGDNPVGVPLERHQTLSEPLLGEGEHPPYLPAEGEPLTLSQALDAGIFAIDRFRAEQKALYAD